MFQAILAKLVAQAGARWAMIVGSDGVLLETDHPSFRGEAEPMAAVYAAFYRAARKAATDTDMAGLPICLLELAAGKILLQALTTEYLLVLLLSSQEPAGKGFFEMSRVTTPLARELSF
jgi:predicted regulator of Ras-like GTPase activity (Roadblock/LC7/MglB family)